MASSPGMASLLAMVGTLALASPTVADPEFRELHLPVARASNAYAASIHVDGLDPSDLVTWSFTGSLPSGIAMTPSGHEAIFAGTTSQTGAFPILLAAEVSTGNSAILALTLFVNDSAALVPEFLQDEIDGAQAGVRYAQTLRATQPHGSVFYSMQVFAGELPDGLLLGHNGFACNATVFGTPEDGAARPDPWRFVVKIQGNDGAVQLKEFRLGVVASDEPAPFVMTTLALAPAQVGTAYVQPLASAGAPGVVTWSIVSGALPSGLSLFQASGVQPARIAGAPADQPGGPRELTLRATAGSISIDRRFRLFLNETAPAFDIDGPGAPFAEVGEQYPGGVGAQPPQLGTQWRLEGGTLPPGIGGFSFTGFNFYLIVGAPLAGSESSVPFEFVVSGVSDGTCVQRAFEIEVIEAGGVFLEQGGVLALHVDEDSGPESPYNRFVLSALDDEAAPGSLSWTVAQSPAHGDVVFLDGTTSDHEESLRFAYDPDQGFQGSDAFLMRVDDGEGHFDEIVVDVKVEGFANTWTWGRLNGGEPIGGRYSDHASAYFMVRCFSVVQSGVGGLGGSSEGIVYSARSPHLGTYLGSLTESGTWRLAGPTGWSTGADVIPEALDGMFERYGKIDIVPHPDVAGGWIGMARSSFGAGDSTVDIHGYMSHFVNEGAGWKHWSGGTSYDDVRPEKVFPGNWRDVGQGSRQFAFDAANREGIVLGTVDGVSSTINGLNVLTACRYELDNASTRFRRWSQPGGQDGQWAATSSVPHRDSYVLDWFIDSSTWAMVSPAVVHLPGTRDYLVSFVLYRWNSTERRLCLARYLGGPEEWQWWDGLAWQPGDGHTSSYIEALDDLLSGAGHIEPPILVARADGTVSVIATQAGRILEIEYDHSTGAVGAAVDVAGVRPLPDELFPTFTAAVDSAGTTWLAYRADDLRLELRTRDSSGAWSAPELAYATDTRFGVLGIAWSAGRPVVFYRESAGEGSLCFNYALGEDPALNWTHETPLVLSPLVDPGELGPAEAVYVKEVVNGVPPLAIGADDDGYVYAGKHSLSNVVVQPPGADPSGSDNRSWGSYWDHLPLPAGIAIWPEGDKAFVAKSFCADGSGGPASWGAITVWGLSECRDQSYGFWQLPSGFIADWSPQILAGPGNQLWTPSGLAVDRDDGLLYVTSSLENKIHVYDVLDTVDSSSPFHVSEVRIGISAANYPHVDDILEGLVLEGMLASAGGDDYSWISTDWEEVLEAATTHSGFAALGSEGSAFVRHLMRIYKQRRDLPVLLYTYHAPGTLDGQLRAPAALAVGDDDRLWVLDSGNHRVQRFEPDASAGTLIHELTFGTRGRAHGELLFPVSISVTAKNEVFVSDPLNARITSYSGEGEFLDDFDEFWNGSQWQPIRDPLGLWAGRAGYLYLSYFGEAGAVVGTFTR